MADNIAVQKRVVPELTPRIVLRYNILRHVSYAQPVGRRALSQRVGESERSVRREEDALRDSGLISVSADGIRLTKDGEAILGDLGDYVRELVGTGQLEETLRAAFGLEQVIVVAGDSDKDGAVKREMARAAAYLLRELICDGDVVAVTGGTTMAAVASESVLAPGKRDVIVVPARGSLGEDVEKQSDTVAATLAKKLGGGYRLLNLPDDLGKESAASVLSEPKIMDVVKTIRSARIVLHGVGTAVDMARRRNLSPDEVCRIVEAGAVGEAFGFYFAADGKVVYSTSSLGLRLDDLSASDKVISVAGGTRKAEALAAVLKHGFSHIAVTDEGAARRICSLVSEKC